MKTPDWYSALGSEDLSPLTLDTGPLPQAGSWPMGSPHTVEESFAAMARAEDRRRLERLIRVAHLRWLAELD